MEQTSGQGNGGSAVGLRERSKIKRRQAIKEAAREVFLERGYDEATTREIADRAEVSPGTLFAYASTKPELVLMIVNDDLEEITSREFDNAADKPLMEVLIGFCASRYTYWHRLGPLAGPARTEVHWLMLSRDESGPEGTRFKLRNPIILKGLAEQIAARQEKGTLDRDTDPMLAARLLWAIYYGEIDRWLRAPKPSVKEGMAHLRYIFGIALRGLGAKPEEFGTVLVDVPNKSVSRRSGTGRKSRASTA